MEETLPEPGFRQAILTGPVVRATHELLAEDVGLGWRVIDHLRAQIGALTQRIVSTYERNVASGEVGRGHNGMEGIEHLTTLAGGTPGHVYGRAHAGTTTALISLAAHALDNGFRTIIVLVDESEGRVSRTLDALSVVTGPWIVSLTDIRQRPAEWRALRRWLVDRGLVVVCPTTAVDLESLSELLGAVAADRLPALLLDDDTHDMSMHALDEVCETVPHSMVVHLRSTVRRPQDALEPPAFSFVLEPGPGYIGAERFYGEGVFDPESDPPRRAPLRLRHTDEHDRVALTRALAFFVVAASARAITQPSAYANGQSFVCYTSGFRRRRRQFARDIFQILYQFAVDMSTGHPAAETQIRRAYADLCQTADVPGLRAIREDIERRLPSCWVVALRATGDNLHIIRRSPNVIVAGPKLTRELPSLLVSYHVHDPSLTRVNAAAQYATLLGYREPLMPYSRMFLSRPLAAWFQRMYVTERERLDSARLGP